MFSHKNIILFALFVLFSTSSSKVSPDYIQPCPGLKPDCLKKNFHETLPLFVKGIPSLGINSMDPLIQETKKIELELPGGLKVEFSNGTFTGFRKCITESVTMEHLTANIELRCNLTLKGKYKAVGKILLFAINGDGDFKIKTNNLALKGKVDFEDKTRDGVVYREVKNYKMTYTYDGDVNFVFTNLFKGNPELSQTVLAFLNENWKQVVDEFGKPIVDTVIHMVFKIIKKFFSVIPKNELYI